MPCANTTTATAATALPLGRASPDALALRVASAAILAPAALAAAWFGPTWLSIAAMLAAAVMGWEWGRLCSGGRFGPIGIIVVASEVAGLAAAAAGLPLVGLTLLGSGAAAVLALGSQRDGGAAGWSAFGVLWIGVPCVGLVWLAQDPATGRATVLWIFALVWATDVAGYVVGRAVGGPRLAPHWSPHKTWSGFLGGIAAAGVVGLGAERLLGAPLLSPIFWASLGLAVVEQLGDLAESVAKRRFGVKDASRLIPGHGGFLDRLDGMLAVAAAASGAALLGGGSVLAWR